MRKLFYHIFHTDIILCDRINASVCE